MRFRFRGGLMGIICVWVNGYESNDVMVRVYSCVYGLCVDLRVDLLL